MKKPMGVQIGARPDSGFDDPIGMLKDCHGRIQHFLEILVTVAALAQGRALTAEETSAIDSALHYFRTGGERHTADEEESLFPRLRAQSTDADVAKLAALEEDHSSAARLHEEVENLYTQWSKERTLSADAGKQLSEATRQLDALYKAHIEVEESVVFPHAARTLDRATLATIGEEFRGRRG
jgi:hemerythrin-like domain-containing protein